jgi:hypothetical protein
MYFMFLLPPHDLDKGVIYIVSFRLRCIRRAKERGKRALMRRSVDSFLLSSWEPQEEGMMSTAASFFLRKKPRFVRPGKSQYSRR